MENNKFQLLLHNILDMDQRTTFKKKKTIKLLKESVDKNLYDLGIGRGFLDHIKKSL